MISPYDAKIMLDLIQAGQKDARRRRALIAVYAVAVVAAIVVAILGADACATAAPFRVGA